MRQTAIQPLSRTFAFNLLDKPDSCRLKSSTHPSGLVIPENLAWGGLYIRLRRFVGNLSRALFRRPALPWDLTQLLRRRTLSETKGTAGEARVAREARARHGAEVLDLSKHAGIL